VGRQKISPSPRNRWVPFPGLLIGNHEIAGSDFLGPKSSPSSHEIALSDFFANEITASHKSDGPICVLPHLHEIRPSNFFSPPKRHHTSVKLL
ncbi:hypothetical protein HN873_028392, partial [Arachis hypogaea]